MQQPFSLDIDEPQGEPTLDFRNSLFGDHTQLVKNLELKARHRPMPDGSVNRLHEVRDFGSNPGNLRMFQYQPACIGSKPALLVVLHGCTQTAAGYVHGAGWSTLADRYGFALLLPEQQRANNPNGCFNWFNPEDVSRDHGEVCSIRQMIDQITQEQNIDRQRIFITGLSAGGAMTSAMLACYPEVFAGGAIVSGLPFGAATNMQEAFESMYQCPSRPARQWGDLVRNAAARPGRWPIISIWHGGADKTVIPSNANELLKQWTDVHDLPVSPSRRGVVDGYPRQVWINENGEEVIESYSISQMAHGTPLATGDGDGKCGVAGPFLLDVGISSSYHIVKFFGLVPKDGDRNSTADRRSRAADDQQFLDDEAAPDVSQNDASHDKERLRSAKSDRQGLVPEKGRIDVGAIITKALRAAGLVKTK